MGTARVADEVVARARAEASAAAQRAGVRVVELTTAEQAHVAGAVLDRVWGLPPDGCLIDPSILIALAHSGNYLVGAIRGKEMVGVTAGWFASERPLGVGTTLHSHIAGVQPGDAGRGAGQAMKLDQRAWALERGITTVTWTTDPLVARNVHVNITRLGATVAEYRVDEYGPMRDGINVGDQSDRILLRWAVDGPVGGIPPGQLPDAPRALARSDDEFSSPVPDLAPLDASARICRIAIPEDAETLVLTRPEEHSLWRVAVREALCARLAAGWRVLGFDKGTCEYVLEAP